MLQEFKNLVNQAVSQIGVHENDPIEICKYLNIDTTMGYARTWVTDKLRNNIVVILTSSNKSDSITEQTLTDLQEALIYESVLFNSDNSEYLTIIKILRSTNEPLPSFDQTEIWGKVLVFVKDYEIFNSGTYTVRNRHLREEYPKDYDLALAAIELKQMGVEVKLNDVTLEFNSGLENIAESIEKDIKKIGGILVMRSIFNHLLQNNYYFPAYSRFLVINKISNLPHQTKAMIPFGYILNLCVKYPTELPEESILKKDLQNKIDSIVKKTILLATIMKIRQYGSLENLFQPLEKLPKFVSQLALFDSVYSFPSIDLLEIIDYMKYFFLWLDSKKFSEKFGFTSHNLITVTETIEKLSTLNGPNYIYLSSLKKHLKDFDDSKITSILNYFSHEVGKVNAEYKFVTDYEKVDFGFKPLIKMSPTKFLLCDKSWCAVGFYEVFASLARELDTVENECNNQIGYALEEYIYSKLSEKNINFSHGKYADGTKPDGEVDAIIESEKDITLIEIKKKVLTRKSKTGSDIHVLIDLASSLLDAHVQTGRTELLLRTKGSIDLVEKSDSIKTVKFLDRNIERTAITQWDYGSFQDRTIINAFKKIEKKRILWEKQAIDLQAIDETFSHFPFFNCWFLSLSQLLVILRYSNNNDEFAKVLKSTKHITHGTNNFYMEFYFSHLLTLMPAT
jgi:hypothetical protein